MTATPESAGAQPGHAPSSRLRRLGLSSWSALGVIALVVVISLGIGALSGIVVPLIIAVILGTILDPLVDFLERHRVPPALAAVIALLASIALMIGLLFIVVWGFVQQLPEITKQLMLGWDSFLVWARSLEIDAVLLEQGRLRFTEYAPRIGQGLLGAVSNTFSGAVAFGIGAFFAFFFLFFVLRDGHRFPGWMAQVTKLNADLVEDVATVARQSLRGYFRGVAVTALITAPIFIIPLLVLRIPLAGSIFVLYFFLSFIPFLGAWITAAFAILIAFGSGGPTAALIVTIALVISNGTIQSVVSSWALGSSLKIHPVAVLLATLVGGAVAGMLGMVLGAPLAAATARSIEVVKEHTTPADPEREPDGPDAVPPDQGEPDRAEP